VRSTGELRCVGLGLRRDGRIIGVGGRSVTVQLHPYTRASPFLDEAVRIFVQTWPEYEPDSAYASFVRSAGRRDFRGLVAVSDGMVVGFGFGARSSPGIWWHKQMMNHLGREHPALRDAWRLEELAVLEAYRGRGIGGRLHDALVEAQPCPRMLLSTYASNTRARAIYERRGWYVLHPAFTFPYTAHTYVVMAKELAGPSPVMDSRSPVSAEGGVS
jgi:ribosomal protein S18 acetylase RimI-like enzyme